jgi:sugar phosphate isomerase/epimerase
MQSGFEGRAAARSAPVILASFYTLAGDVTPAIRGGMELSSRDVADRIEAASAAGYKGIGFADRDLGYWWNVHGPARIRRWLDESDLDVVELEMLHDWYAGGESRAASDARLKQLIEWAGELGARHIKVGTGFSGPTVERSQLVAGLAELCEKVAPTGAGIALEPMPVAALRTPHEGLELIEEAAAPNAGLFIDVWHVVRAGVDYESLSDIPGERITAVELIDGAADPVQNDIFVDGIDYRRPVGTGEFGVDRFLDVLLATGFNGTFGDENLSLENRARSLSEAARVNFDATRQAVEGALARSDA